VNLTVRRALVSATVPVVLLALAGCGGDDTSVAKASSSSTSASTASPSDSTGSAGSAGSTSSGEPVTGEAFAAVLKSALDNATTAKLSMDLGGSGGSAEGEADYTKSPPELAMTMKLPELGGDVEVRMVAGTMYMKSASFGDKWVSASLDDPISPLGSLGGLFDMTKDLQAFADAVTSATRASDDVDGETLERYTATVDTQKLLASMPALSSAAGSLPKTMTQEWWFDDDGLIRKFSGGFGTSEMTMTFSDWGDNVSIGAPPADEVTSMPGTSASS